MVLAYIYMVVTTIVWFIFSGLLDLYFLAHVSDGAKPLFGCRTYSSNVALRCVHSRCVVSITPPSKTVSKTNSSNTIEQNKQFQHHRAKQTVPTPSSKQFQHHRAKQTSCFVAHRGQDGEAVEVVAASAARITHTHTHKNS